MIPETLPDVVNSSIVGLQDPSFLNLIISKSPKGLLFATKHSALIGCGLPDDKFNKAEKVTILSQVDSLWACRDPYAFLP